MNKIIFGGLLIASLTACQHKIGYVDNSKLLDEYQEKKDLESLLQGKIDKYDRKRDSISRAFQLKVQNFESQAKNLSQAAIQEKQNELMQESQILQQHLMEEQQAIQEESRTKMDTLLKKVKTFVKEYGKKHNYDFILGANDGGSVHYGKEDKDITQELIKELNEKK
ncbi:MAG: OmpH family outer membrane protein [Capnocytophaga sp.]|nr:OmpH family outer membrane protein [Capnocytophaga sp.]